MGKIKGRPKRAISFEKQIRFFLPSLHYEDLVRRAAGADLSIAEFMRQLIFEGKVTPRFTEEERYLFKRLVALSNDFSDLVKIAQMEDAPDLVPYFLTSRDQTDEVINTIFQRDLRPVSTGHRFLVFGRGVASL